MSGFEVVENDIQIGGGPLRYRQAGFLEKIEVMLQLCLFTENKLQRPDSRSPENDKEMLMQN